MSYDNIAEYKIIPTQPFKINKRCARCGCKQTFSCKDHFRVNANGSRLDIWLIYGCKKCGYTYNLPIYERISPVKIPEQEYYKFLSNEKQKIYEIGTDKNIFIKNKTEIAWDLSMYEIVPITKNILEWEKDNVIVRLYNPYDIPIRKDKVLGSIFHITRKEAKRLLNNGNISVVLERV